MATPGPLSTPEQLLTFALTICEEIIEKADPDGEVSELQAATLAVSAAVKCSRAWKPERIADFSIWYSMVLTRDIDHAIAAGNLTTYGEACQDLIDAA